MEDKSQQPLSAQELAEIDAQYQPFPAFKDWPIEVPAKAFWEAEYALFTSVSSEASKADLAKAQQVALRTAAFDTGAIEGLYSTDRGLTFTVATQAASWEQQVSERDTEALDLFKAQLLAFELVLDLATDHFPKVTQAWLRRLHEEVTAAQATYVVHTAIGPQEQPLPKGEYKRFPNHVRTADGEIHAYAPVETTQAEMQRLVDELKAVDFEGAHPVLQAAYVHYALSVIHPFADGNGRVARAAASAYTYRAASVPLLVQAHDRDRYLTTLAVADSGDFTPFLEFTSKASSDALALVTESLEAARSPQPEDLLNEFREVFLAQGDLTHQQLDEIANSFADDLLEVMSGQLGSLSMPEGVDIRWIGGSGGNRSDPPEGFRKLVTPSPRFLVLEFESAAPAAAVVSLNLDVFVSSGSDPASTVLIQEAGSKKQLKLGLSDLQPQLSSAGRFRTESFTRRMVAFGLDWLLKKSKKRLQRNGY